MIQFHKTKSQTKS